MGAENYYEVLGLKRGVGDEEVKQAFRELAKSFHPDRNPGDPEAEHRFKLVNTAYEALKDASRRRAYDEWLSFAKKHERSRLAQWSRLAALLAVLVLGPSLALYWAMVLTDPPQSDKIGAGNPSANVQASRTGEPATDARTGNAVRSGRGEATAALPDTAGAEPPTPTRRPEPPAPPSRVETPPRQAEPPLPRAETPAPPPARAEAPPPAPSPEPSSAPRSETPDQAPLTESSEPAARPDYLPPSQAEAPAAAPSRGSLPRVETPAPPSRLEPAPSRQAAAPPSPRPEPPVAREPTAPRSAESPPSASRPAPAPTTPRIEPAPTAATPPAPSTPARPAPSQRPAETAVPPSVANVPESGVEGGRTPPGETVSPRPSLRDLTGADDTESGPAPRQSVPREAPAPLPPAGGRTAALTPQEPAEAAREGAARSMARMIAELKEPDGGRSGANINPDRAPRQTTPSLEPPRDNALRDGPDGNFADCAQCPIMSVVTARDLVTGRAYSGTTEGRRSRPPSTFAISKYEVSVREWNVCVEEGGCRRFRSYGPGGPHGPVLGITNAEAADYASWLSRKTGRSYRLLKTGGWDRREASRRGGVEAEEEQQDPWSGPRRYDRSSAVSTAGFRVSRSLR